MNEEKALEEMSRLAGTQTEKNLRAAFAGEAQAHVCLLYTSPSPRDS